MKIPIAIALWLGLTAFAPEFHPSMFQDFKIESTYKDPTNPYSVWIIRGYVGNEGANMHQFNEANVFPGVCSGICTIKIVRH